MSWGTQSYLAQYLVISLHFTSWACFLKSKTESHKVSQNPSSPIVPEHHRREALAGSSLQAS